MEQYLKMLIHCPLFLNISYQEIQLLLSCLAAKEQEYNKNEIILLSGNPINFIGIVISGSIKIIREDAEGNQTLLGEAIEGELFAETFTCAEIYNSPVSIVAKENTKVLLCDYKKVITTCNSSCRFHNQLIENMLKVIANKNIYLNKKIEVISKRTLRDKIITYLEYASKGRKKFTINLNREELASFLCADRSALSNKLSKMQKENLICYSKNAFEILNL